MTDFDGLNRKVTLGDSATKPDGKQCQSMRMVATLGRVRCLLGMLERLPERR
jgi:hypothetical protein